MDALRYSWLFFVTHLARTLRTKRVIVCALIAAVPVAMVVVVSSSANRPPRDEVFMYSSWFLLLQIVTPLIALLMGAAVISEEIDDRTITFPFSRPAPRASLLFGRFAAAAVILAVLLGASSIGVAYAASAVGSAPPVAQIQGELATSVLVAAVLGGIVYTALFAAVGVFLRHPMIVGLAYCFVIEGIAANSLPGRTRSLAVQHYVRGIVASGSDSWKKVNTDLFQVYESTSASITALAVILIGALLLGSWAISRKEYVLEA